MTIHPFMFDTVTPQQRRELAQLKRQMKKYKETCAKNRKKRQDKNKKK